MVINKDNNENEKKNQEITFLDFLIQIKQGISFCKKNYKTFILTSLIGIIFGLTYGIFEKPRYTAILTFAMEDDKNSNAGGITNAIGIASSLGIDIGSGGGGAFAASNLTELMKSRLLIQKVLLMPYIYENKKISLAEFYMNIKNIPSKGVKIPFEGNSSLKLNRSQDSLLNELYIELIKDENLTIQQKDKKISILTIKVVSENEDFSKQFCEKLATETSNFYIETKSRKARNNVIILQKQADSLKNELNYSITGVATETDNVYNLNPSLNIKSAPSKRKQIDVQANTAVLTQVVVQLELAKINLRKETPLIQTIDLPTKPLLKSKFGKLKSAILGLFLSFIFTSLYFYLQNLKMKNFN